MTTTTRNSLRSLAMLIIFPLGLAFRKRRLLAILPMILVLCITAGCYQKFYLSKDAGKLDPKTVATWSEQRKTFILHHQHGNALLLDPRIEGDSMVAWKDSVYGDHKRFLNVPIAGKSTVVKKKYLPVVTSEVHLFTNKAYDDSSGMVSIPVSALDKTIYYEADKKAIRNSAILSTLGIVVLVLGIFVVAFTIAAALACNCPQVYVDHAGQQEFIGGMYSGAIYAPLERQDMMALPYDGHTTAPYQLSVANPEAEEQFINSERILEVSHPAGTRVLAERNGTLHTISKPVPPQLAMAGDEEVTAAVLKKDNIFYAFDDSLPGFQASTLDLIFPNTENNKSGKLVLHGGNSTWSGYVYKQFFSMFGNKYQSWLERKEKDDPKDLQSWELQQTLPIMVYLGTDTGWRFIDHLAMTGNTSSRDLILGIDLAGTQGPVRIRLITAYRFWNIDQAAMDFTDDVVGEKHWKSITSTMPTVPAFNDSALQANDQRYVHLKGHDAIQLSFVPAPAADGISYSYFLVGSGYYHAAVPQNTNAPDMATLVKFKEPHAFDAYSRTLYDKDPAMAANIARVDLRKNKQQ